MTPLPIAAWRASLATMETALSTTLGALDRYQVGWVGLLGDHPSGPATGSAVAAVQDRLRRWDDQLAAAADLAAAVERQLAAAEVAVGRWHEMFTNWRELIQRGWRRPGPAEAVN